eukprot:c15549_g1_i1.p3 GENE.c15549_g1_i1~~c15549_g1_i1.p3  ORF type:complete len:233 (+),score=23.68 c15549_g1_i1:617-1315(+)
MRAAWAWVCLLWREFALLLLEMGLLLGLALTGLGDSWELAVVSFGFALLSAYFFFRHLFSSRLVVSRAKAASIAALGMGDIGSANDDGESAVRQPLLGSLNDTTAGDLAYEAGGAGHAAQPVTAQEAMAYRVIEVATAHIESSLRSYQLPADAGRDCGDAGRGLVVGHSDARVGGRARQRAGGWAGVRRHRLLRPVPVPVVLLWTVPVPRSSWWPVVHWSPVTGLGLAARLK